MAGSVQKLDELLGQLNKFTRALNSREGTLGQLVNDPALYNNLSQAAINVNKLTRELQPILSNAKIFTDEIARVAPSHLGLDTVALRTSGHGDGVLVPRPAAATDSGPSADSSD